ncbi:PqiC family protein [Actimicrobium sp. CCI2.3]|uniref:PqiC family protein n=1 Tax=Actimicrobium sp. CCI2.3 TaxID=3048616 RepID=UPI002AB3CA36|nr:PqiC family protein [Actimicrobium sp. CCI2.3]MDY7575314.1 PqiC family protein [Actimicrobium sp. CCI2.3]MEB0023662.1 PqiC family protein [Actimicrobium sp. CCI2.3]
MTSRLPRTLAALLAASLLLAACASTPATQFYTLEALSASGTSTSTSAVRIGHVTVPELVDRPQMVLRSGSNQVNLLEQRRWAESLRSAIARVVAANLAVPGSTATATTTTTTATTTVDIDVDRFDSQLGVAVDLSATWHIRPAAGSVRSGSMRWHEPVSGNDYADLAAAHSRALAELSRQIAAAVDTPP